ncbi:MAG: DNA/RNA nuclease SfsA [Alphaproteobacteria bacterium]
MRFSSPLVHGTLVQRYKRFLADVQLLNGTTVIAHCTNTGSMMGCQTPGSAVCISRCDRPGRRLAYTWEMIRVNGGWVGINTLVPNRLVAEGIEAGAVHELLGYSSIRREVCTRQGVRLDIGLDGPCGLCFVEVKNVTLAIDGMAAFPDAVSARGTKHLQELIRLKRKGHRSALIFVIQREDCVGFRPADEIDPKYGHWLRCAMKAGVEIFPYQAKVTPGEIVLTTRLRTQF